MDEDFGERNDLAAENSEMTERLQEKQSEGIKTVGKTFERVEISNMDSGEDIEERLQVKCK